MNRKCFAGLLTAWTVAACLGPVMAAPKSTTTLSVQDLLGGGSVEITLGDGSTLVLLDPTVQSLPAGGFTWTAAVEGEPFAEAIFASKDGDRALGRIRRQGHSVVVNVPVVGEAEVSMIDSTALPRPGEPVRDFDSIFVGDFEPVSSPPLKAPPQFKGSLSEDPTPVSVMILYTPAAKEENSQIETLAHLLVAELNLVISSSQPTMPGPDDNIDVQFRLAHVGEVDYLESSGSEALDSLVLKDGTMDEVHELRDAYATDLVLLLTAALDVCGIASLLSPAAAGGEPSSDQGFGVVKQECALADLGFAHEVGHTMGAQHDRYAEAEDSVASALVPYAFGHVNVSQAFYTIMAYEDECIDSGITACALFPVFSNPHKLVNGQPVGVPESDPSAAHNLKVISMTAPEVAEFRLPRMDIDDGTPDGNQRYFPAAAGDYLLEDADGDGAVGDGRVDMSDFRRWRDWLLLAEGAVSYSSLDGAPDHPKKDVNQDGLLLDPLSEALLPRGDFNGDGEISRNPNDRSIVPGRFEDAVSDLEAFETFYTLDGDSNYPVGELASLIDSADLTISMQSCLDIPGVNSVVSRVALPGGVTKTFTHTAEQPAYVYSAPIEATYLATVDDYDANGQYLGTKERSFEFERAGQDHYWLSPCGSQPPEVTVEWWAQAHGFVFTRVTGGRVDGRLVEDENQGCGDPEKQCNADYQIRFEPGGIGAAQSGSAASSLEGGQATGSATGFVSADLAIVPNVGSVPPGGVVGTLSGSIRGTASASASVGECDDNAPATCARSARARGEGGGSLSVFGPSIDSVSEPTCDVIVTNDGNVVASVSVGSTAAQVQPGQTYEATGLIDCHQIHISTGASHNVRTFDEADDAFGPAAATFGITLRRS